MKNLAAIAAVALTASVANAATSYNFVAPANVVDALIDGFAGIGKFYSSQYFYRGFVRGLQQNSDNVDHPCFQSYLGLETQFLSFPGFITALEAGEGQKNTAANSLI